MLPSPNLALLVHMLNFLKIFTSGGLLNSLNSPTLSYSQKCPLILFILLNKMTGDSRTVVESIHVRNIFSRYVERLRAAVARMDEELVLVRGNNDNSDSPNGNNNNNNNNNNNSINNNTDDKMFDFDSTSASRRTISSDASQKYSLILSPNSLMAEDLPAVEDTTIHEDEDVFETGSPVVEAVASVTLTKGEEVEQEERCITNISKRIREQRTPNKKNVTFDVSEDTRRHYVPHEPREPVGRCRTPLRFPTLQGCWQSLLWRLLWLLVIVVAVLVYHTTTVNWDWASSTIKDMVNMPEDLYTSGTKTLNIENT